MQQNVKEFFNKSKEKITGLDKGKKIAIGIGISTIILASAFTISYAAKNKYGILYSGLDTYDAANITQALEDKGIENKIEGDTILVPKEQVDRLRLELSSSITNGSKGFELMDEGSSLSMTDEEFQIKKLRMLQGEIEKTIKTFPQVDDARVHITQGQESVFSSDSKQGKAAVYVSVKTGQTLDETQIKSIMSLVSASTTNIPKQNIEVIDQNMNLLSEGIYDEDGNSITNGVGLAASRSAEKEVSSELEKSIVSMLEAIFGTGKVKATVNATLNFDTVETNEVKIDPDTVIKSEYRSENNTASGGTTGSPVDNNMSNTEDTGSGNATSLEEQIEYEVGKTETRTISSSGDIKRITASVAIDGKLSDDVMYNVQRMVESALGISAERGDLLTVVGMEFNNDASNIFAETDTTGGISQETLSGLIMAGIAGLIALILIIILILVLSKKKKAKIAAIAAKEEAQEEEEDLIAKLMRERELQFEREIAMDKELSLEDEVKLIATKSPEEVTELIKTWLSD